jgi:chromosome segregation ATPase
MLVQIARAIRDRRLTEDSLPTTYTVAYQVAAMKPEVLALAKEQGLVRPDATKAELIEFKRQLRSSTARSEAPRLDPARLTRDLATIDRRLEALRAEVASLEAEKAEKGRLLSLVADLVNSPAPPED